MQNQPAPMTPVPPHSVDAERSIVGALLQDPRIVSLAAEQLTPDDFYIPQHKAVYEAVLALYTASQSVDLMTVGEQLSRLNQLEFVGGAAYLLQTIRFVPTTANTQSYIDIVREKSALRKLIQTAQAIQSRAYTQMDDAASILQSAEATLSTVSAKGANRRNQPVKIKDVLPSVFDSIEQNCRNKGVISGIPTGFYDLDRMLTGMHGGELIIVGGRPAMGKTSFALSVAHFAAIRAHKRVLFFSLEMPKEQLVTRVLSLHARVPMQKMRLGDLRDEDWLSIGDAVNDLSSDTLIIDDAPSLTPSQMRSRIKSMIALGEKPDLVLVDYLGIISPDQKGENRQNEVSAITRALKALAREMNVPFMVLAQLSRANAARGDKRPMLTDLRETGSVEQEADAVIFVHRDGYYDQTQDQSEGVLILAKQRNGPTGDVIVRWDMQFAAYQNAHGTLVAKYQ